MRQNIAVAVVVMLGGCARIDPVSTTDRWNPSGVNDANLAAQVGDPTDLVEGRGRADSDGRQAAEAVARLRQNHVKALPNATMTTLQLGSQTAGADGGNGGAN